MIKIYRDVEQGSDRWHGLRYGKISGTSSKGLFVDSDTLLNELIAARLEPFKMEDPGYQSYDMLRGKELEPYARMALSRELKIDLKQAGWIENLEIPIIGISPDVLSECETVSAEIKCPSASVHIATLRAGDIPDKNIHQCLHYFTVNPKLERHYFASFRPECKIKLFYKLLTPESVINIGTKSKPVTGTIESFAIKAREKAKELHDKANTEVKRLEKK